MPKEGKTLVTNRAARHEYFIDETYEAGLELKGTEVKSIRMGKANLKESYCAICGGEVFIQGMHISPYAQGNIFNVDPLRDRKLLLHKREIQRLIGMTQRQGYTLIPLSLYLKKGRVKLELALARGKKLYDKRDAAAKRTAQREMEKAFSRNQRYRGES